MDKGFGAIPSPKDFRDYTLSYRALPIEQESYCVGGIRIKNQGTKPTCVSHALSSIIEYNYKKEIGEYERFSTDFIYGLRDNKAYKTEGMYIREALSVVKNYGDVFYEDLPTNSYAAEAAEKVKEKEESLKKAAEPYKISAYFKIEDINALKYSLLNNGPAIGGMYWYKNAELEDKVYNYKLTKDYFTHAVIIIGWTKNYIIVQNSWGITWGWNGCFLVPEKDFFKIFYEVYGITDDIASVKKPSKVLKAIVPVVNATVSAVDKIKNNLKK